MTALAMIVAGAWLLMLLAPDARGARLLRHALVERPAAVLDRVTPTHVLMTIALLVVVGTAMWFEAGDLLSFMSLAAPEVVGWALTFEIGTLVEAGTAVLALVVSRRAIGVRTTLRVTTGRSRDRAGVTRQRRPRRRAMPSPANDDADPAPPRLVA